MVSFWPVKRIFRKLLYRQDVPPLPVEKAVMDSIGGKFVEKAVVFSGSNLFRCVGIRLDGMAFYGIGISKTDAYRKMRKYATEKE